MALTDEERAAIADAKTTEHKTHRPTIATLEEILYQPIPVLDHGFVRVVDYMGDDTSIVQAARVSYGRGTTRLRDDRGLIRYLMRHRHTTPFEMCDIKLHVKLPIFVARQWIRHRTACLAGDAKLYFDAPSGPKKNARKRHNITVEKFYQLWHEGTSHKIPKKKPLYVENIDAQFQYSIAELAKVVKRRPETLRNLVREGKLAVIRKEAKKGNTPYLFILGKDWIEYAQKEFTVHSPIKKRLSTMNLRMCDESTGEINHTHVADIWQTGVRPVFKVTLQNGYSLTMTQDHLCLTEAGWQTLAQATHLHLTKNETVTWNAHSPKFAINGIPAYQDSTWLKTQRAQGIGIEQIAQSAGASYHTIRKWLKIHNLKYSPQEKSLLSRKAQRGQKRTIKREPMSSKTLESIRRARSGERSNFWRGAVSRERENIGRWTREQAKMVHQQNEYRCVICKGKESLAAHHIDPVWNNPDRARDLQNLTTLCGRSHRDLHSKNLELSFLNVFQSNVPLQNFWRENGPQSRPEAKKLPRVKKLIRTYQKVVKIEYAGLQKTYDLEVTGPYHNFVANGFIVHNSVNEYSARYSVLDREFYIPKPEHLGVQSTSNRQGRGESLPQEQAEHVLRLLTEDANLCYQHYSEFLKEASAGQSGQDKPGGQSESDRQAEHHQETDSEKLPLSRELARMNLTLNYYTQWYWKINLHNLLHFVALRIDPHAQYEIRVYAEAIASILAKWVPLAWEAFSDYRLHAAEFSSQELRAIKLLLSGQTPNLTELGLSKREQDEFWRKLDSSRD